MDDQDFSPDWEEEDLQEGLYIWPVYIEWAKLKDPSSEKPYLLVGAIVEEFPKDDSRKAENVGFKFDFRVYLSKKSKGFAAWFLKKFGYPEALMPEGRNPIIRSSEVAGLHGQVLVEVSMDQMMMLRTNVKGYDSFGGTDLKKRMDKILEDREKAQESDPAEPEAAKDLEEDVRQAGGVPREPGEEMVPDIDDPFGSFN